MLQRSKDLQRFLETALRVLSEEEGALSIRELAQKILQLNPEAVEFCLRSPDEKPLPYAEQRIYYLLTQGRIPRDRIALQKRPKKTEPFFCGHCGSKLQKPPVCPKCGYKTFLHLPQK